MVATKLAKLFSAVFAALFAVVAEAEVWYVPGWLRTEERDGLAFASCTNVFRGAQCRFWQWDGNHSWTKSAANADAAAKRLADEIAATNAEFRSNLTLVGHSLGGRIVARTLAEFSRRGIRIERGIMLAPAIPMDDGDAALMGAGCCNPAVVVVNPEDVVLKYCYAMAGGESGPALGSNGSPQTLPNVVEYAVPKTVTAETEIAAFWGRSAALKRLCSHLAAFYFTELGRIIDGSPSPNAQVRVPQGRVNLEWKVIDAGLWWSVLEERGGWKLERNVVTCHCRIIDPGKKRMAWGSEAQMRRSFGKILVQMQAVKN